VKTDPIVVLQSYDAPIATVWQAITDQIQTRQWFFEQMTSFEPEVGFATNFEVEFEGKIYDHILRVNEVIPQKRIVYDWRYGGYPGKSTVAWELTESTEGTVLTLTHTGHESLILSQDDFDVRREDCEAGWKYFVQESLRSFLER